jgi:hypothetical protein
MRMDEQASPAPEAPGTESIAPPAEPASAAAGPPAAPARYWVTAPEPTPTAGSGAPSVLLAGIVLLLFGLLILIGGLFVVLGGAVVRDLDIGLGPSVTDAAANVIVGVGVAVALYGGIEVIGAVGIFARRGWGRAIGIITAIIGVLFGLLGVAGAAVGARTDPDTASGVVAILAVLVGYGYAFIALALGGHAFRRTA